jgi:hypothetical protein
MGQDRYYRFLNWGSVHLRVLSRFPKTIGKVAFIAPAGLLKGLPMVGRLLAIPMFGKLLMHTNGMKIVFGHTGNHKVDNENTK